MGIAEELESPQCMSCIHKNEEELICKAFAFGIPDEIFRNIVLHNRVFEEQQGDYIYEGV